MTWDEKNYRLAHESALMMASPFSVLAVTGADHIPFLHNILSQDIQTMRENEWREAALLSATSHVAAYMTAIRANQSTLLLGAPDQAEPLRAKLEKFIITEDVSLEDKTHQWQMIEIWGPKPESFVASLPSSALIESVARNQRQRALLPASEKKLPENICRDPNLRELLRVENGLLEFGVDINETIMLSETRLEKIAASESKGCYPGQEVVAKIETYKRLNRGFARFVWNGNNLPEKKAVIYEPEKGNEIGCLTSRAYSPYTNKTTGLGWLKRGYFEKPADVLIEFKTNIPAQTFSLI